MSLPFETDLTAYAHECTLQRRRYEECQKIQQSDAIQTTAALADAADQSVVEALTESQFDECTEPTTQGYLSDLLEISVEPLAWDDKSLLQDTSSGVRKHQWRSDRSQPTPQHATYSAQKNVNPVSYSAP